MSALLVLLATLGCLIAILVVVLLVRATNRLFDRLGPDAIGLWTAWIVATSTVSVTLLMGTAFFLGPLLTWWSALPVVGLSFLWLIHKTRKALRK